MIFKYQKTSFRFLFFLLLIQTTLLNASARTQVIMGTFVTISADANETHYIEDGFKIFKDIDANLSTYKPHSTVSKLNQNQKVELDSYTKEALELSRYYFNVSDGYFDISANIKRRGIKIDFGGMGKGYGVDKVSEYFFSKGVRSAIVAASGDIRCLNFCPIEVNNPFSKGVLATFTTKHKNQGITTSGNYNKFIGSRENNHLLNPKTKKSQTKFISITLTGLIKSSDLDAYATAASVMPLEKAYEFLDALDVAFIILQSDGKLVVSKNINFFVDKLLIDYTREENPKYIEYE